MTSSKSSQDLFHTLKVGSIYTHSEIMGIFQCGIMGGIRTSTKTQTIVLFSDKHGPYDDRWIHNKENNIDIFEYTGTGQKGNQAKLAANKRLRESNENGYRIFLFQGCKNKYTYKGEMALWDAVKEETQVINGKDELVYIFPLYKVNDYLKTISPASVTTSLTENSDTESPLHSGPSTRTVTREERTCQDRLRKYVLNKKKCCEVTGLSIKELLIVSHIKPWKNSSEQERQDPDNVLLLAPNIDRAFDRGFISFKNNGNVIISKALPTEEMKALSIHHGLKLNKRPSAKCCDYLEYHRKEVLRK